MTWETRTIWEGELIASITAHDEESAWSDFREQTGTNDGYTVQLIRDDQVIAEHTNPDENGEI